MYLNALIRFHRILQPDCKMGEGLRDLKSVGTFVLNTDIDNLSRKSLLNLLYPYCLDHVTELIINMSIETIIRRTELTENGLFEFFVISIIIRNNCGW